MHSDAFEIKIFNADDAGAVFTSYLNFDIKYVCPGFRTIHQKNKNRYLEADNSLKYSGLNSGQCLQIYSVLFIRIDDLFSNLPKCFPSFSFINYLYLIIKL